MAFPRGGLSSISRVDETAALQRGGRGKGMNISRRAGNGMSAGRSSDANLRFECRRLRCLYVSDTCTSISSHAIQPIVLFTFYILVVTKSTYPMEYLASLLE